MHHSKLDTKEFLASTNKTPEVNLNDETILSRLTLELCKKKFWRLAKHYCIFLVLVPNNFNSNQKTQQSDLRY